MILIITDILSKNAIVIIIIIFLTVTRIKIISIKETEALYHHSYDSQFNSPSLL